MCGIWASVGSVPPDAAIDLVAHRGPDGRGWQKLASTAGPVVLAHRRLAIIDTSMAGIQPMAWSGGRRWIVHNGEIYNYLELRRELEALGHPFRTETDTEVILAAYAQWGAGSLERFIGMFAFVIYDRDAETLFAARDRFGIKPLYLWQSAGQLAFASEIKQFRALPEFTARVNAARAYDFLAGALFDHTDETLFAGVRQLRGGECVSVELPRWRADGALPVRRWYELPPANTREFREDVAAEGFAHLLADAVRLHLRADVTVGSCLSGGLDSSSIVSLAVEELRRQRARNAFHTVSACFAEAEVDESRFIDAVVAKTGVHSSRVMPQPERLIAEVEAIARHQDEPFGSTSIFAQWCVFERAAAERITVMLDGQGADEQLAGYHAGFATYYRQLAAAGDWRGIAETLRGRLRRHRAPLRGEARSILLALLPPPWRTPLVGAVRGREMSVWLGRALIEAGGGTRPLQAALARDGFGPMNGLGEACRAQLKTTSLPMLLHYEDRNSMAHGIEARVPFLDHRLVEFSLALGDHHKMNGAETKAVLRRGMHGHLPEAVRRRSDKLGFATPEERWFKGPLRTYVLDGIEAAISRAPAFFAADGLRRVAREMLAGTRPFDFMIWRTVSFGLWARVFDVAI
ncbi:MAG TPA: asparagine synthase (glutamine-hydrolyzing) [Stellaceae bacterium]|nr:asparagine synthase (glutamine-hydrolyzing) [Stellaceae bacterium]